jgi:RimJ/RimL family protein N-acetyltransferase
MQLTKAYRIETERLVIRCYAPKDAILLKEAIDGSLDHLRPWMPWAQHEPESLQAKTARLRKYRGQFDLGQDYVFGIFNKEENELIGSTGLHTRAGEESREIGYWISALHIGKGYALEATKALTKVGFKIEGLDRIEIHCAPNNIRSQRIPQKLGYIHEATLRDRHVDPQGEKRDTMVWTMFKEDYFDKPFGDIELKVSDVAGEKIMLA